MNEPLAQSLLDPEDRLKLQAYYQSNPLHAPYQRRIQILLLADDRESQERIATSLDVPILHVRQLLRAYNRQGMSMFPRSVISPPPYSPDTSIDKAGRLIMAGLLETLGGYIEDLESDTSVKAVHESRKNCRRLRTALRVFSPYYQKKEVKRFRRGFKKFMTNLGRSRDIAVFLIKLNDYFDQQPVGENLSEDENQAFAAFKAFWEGEQEQADAQVRSYLATGKFRSFLDRFELFVNSSSESFDIASDAIMPRRTSHVAPPIIADKVTEVRAFDEYVGDATPETYHRLRIALKELRYTLEFFEPVMGPSVEETIEIVKRLLLHLGDLNDARMHLEMLAEISNEEILPVVEIYQQSKEAELNKLVKEFPNLWSTFESPNWRKALYEAVSVL